MGPSSVDHGPMELGPVHPGICLGTHVLDASAHILDLGTRIYDLCAEVVDIVAKGRQE